MATGPVRPLSLRIARPSGRVGFPAMLGMAKTCAQFGGHVRPGSWATARAHSVAPRAVVPSNAAAAF